MATTYLYLVTDDSILLFQNHHAQTQREASTSKVLLDPDEDDDLALYRVDSALVFSEIALQREKLLHNDIQSLK